MATQPTVNRTDLENAFATIRNKRAALDNLFNYVNGPQPLKYSTERLSEAFQDINTHFDMNWATVVVDSVLDRVQLTGFDIGDEASNTKISELFDKLHIDIEADKAHNAALAVTQAYMIVWKDLKNETVLYYNDPRMVHVFYDPANPKVKVYAAKWFSNLDLTQEITLYYPDRLEHWISSKQSTEAAIDKPSAFALDNVEPNPFSVIPVFELHSPGEISKILSLQDAVNKLFADMMIAAEFGAFIQRYVISTGEPGALKNAPNEIWYLPAGDGAGQQTTVGQFANTPLANYLDPMDKIASSIAIITRTPKHYLFTSGSNISGEALLAMESPLVKKVKKRQREFGAQWQDLAQFLFALDGITVEASKIKVIWERAESIQPKTEAEVRQLGVNTGIPLKTLLRREGWTDAEIKQLEKDLVSANKEKQTQAQAVLNDLRIRQQQQNPGDNNVATNDASNSNQN